ncbi:xanthine dehydrogenase molybdopterin binding subunit [Pseudactinotalea sp. HY160]|uniref:xanthine dehydrogenase molybdopterin binding subunit n=1 Tax=Pseudactinotalea sp. HY160 TaxID=2654490 RepID=UPI00128CE1FC|nr:xanthine dehydrogenase molybdopterin binding subunit [Pseudactinotalea sp. HY160]MPV48706.1 xanthine dehydrogenase molybdopterin binding subunit [Pseudactinotalea sp. HY160]
MSVFSSRPLSEIPAGAAAGVIMPHESAWDHVTGKALYTDDLPPRSAHVLYAWPATVDAAHARIDSLDTTRAETMPGVVRVLTAADVPGVNDYGDIGDETLFPDTVQYYGQHVAWVLADSLEEARLAAEAIEISATELPSIVTTQEAIAAGAFQGPQATLQRGDADAALASAPHRLSGELDIQGQEHFYLETQASFATIDEGGQVFVQSSTQAPSHTQEVVARVLGVPSHRVTVQCLRMGGGFGGKETNANGFAAVAALGAVLTGRPVALRLNRTQDLTLTGKRGGFHATWEAGFDDEGHILAYKAVLTADGGFSIDLSPAVVSRALCHVDNAYYLPNVHVLGRIARTNKTSHTAFRGFGAPSGMVVTEDILGQAATMLGIDQEEIRRRNFYAPGQTTPYEQVVSQAERMNDIWAKLKESSRYGDRQREIAEFNAGHEHVKRALAITPVKFGVSFNKPFFNQAGALVLVYKDGSVLINHGGTEMGQGLHQKMLAVAATALGLPLDRVRLAPTRTDKVPNSSATSASTGSDLNGGAVKNACELILDRLAPVAAGLLGVHPNDVRISAGVVSGLGAATTLTWEELVDAAYFQRVSLSATGYYRTEGLYFDQSTYKGNAFKYFARGAAVAEVEVDGYTGAYTTRRVDLLHDVGSSLSPLIDLGQVEGAFVQGAGWLTQEDLRWDTSDGPTRGKLLTQSASTYKLPSFSELPQLFNVDLYVHPTDDGSIYGSKAVGEPPLMLAIAVREALRAAAAAFGEPGRPVELASPATAEAVFWAVEQARRSTPTPVLTAG